jgi:hypothetical protein
MYNGKPYTTPNLEKKLKKMGISINDVDIIEEPKVSDPIDTSIKAYYFINTKNGYTRTSIYPELTEEQIKEGWIKKN